MKKFSVFLCSMSMALFLLCLHPMPSSAFLIEGTYSTEGLAGFTGSFSYTSNSSTLGTVTVSLENTTPEELEGYLVAFGFYLPQMSTVSYSNVGFTSTSGFELIGESTFPGFGSIEASPFEPLDVGVSTGEDWLHKGKPGGLSPGESATFVFTLEGSGLDTLTDGSFRKSALELHNAMLLAARFKGLTASSDKVGAAVPEPATMLLLGTGLIGVAAIGRRKFRKT